MLAFISKFGLSFYIWQFMAIWLVDSAAKLNVHYCQRLPDPERPPLLPAYYAVNGVLAVLSFYLVEVPSRRLLESQILEHIHHGEQARTDHKPGAASETHAHSLL